MIIDKRAVDRKLSDFEYTCQHEINMWTKYSNYETDEECVELEDAMIKWIKENIKGRAMYHHNFVFGFEKQEDLVAFKLMWG